MSQTISGSELDSVFWASIAASMTTQIDNLIHGTPAPADPDLLSTAASLFRAVLDGVRTDPRPTARTASPSTVTPAFDMALGVFVSSSDSSTASRLKELSTKSHKYLGVLHALQDPSAPRPHDSDLRELRSFFDALRLYASRQAYRDLMADSKSLP